MARLKLFLTVRRKWWLPLYLNGAAFFVWCFAWVWSDDEVDDFGRTVAQFAVDHGMVIETTPDDPGDLQ